MGWVDGKSFWFILPAFDDVFVGRESLEGFEPFGEVVCIQEVVQMLSQLLVIFVIVAFDGCLF